MKILVYGCGALGSLLIHYLCNGDNEVSVVARSTYEELTKNGIVVEHVLQKKTTVDQPVILQESDSDEEYDVVFSVMQGQQQLKLLDMFASLKTSLIILVGNNMEADYRGDCGICDGSGRRDRFGRGLRQRRECPMCAFRRVTP